VNGYLSLWLSCPLLSACCFAGAFIYADLWGELSTHLAPRLCLLRVLLCASCCYKLSPFQAHWGGDTAPTFSGLRVYLQLTWKVSLPPSPVDFTSFPAPDYWECAAAPAGQHVCLQLTWEVGLPPSPVEFSSLRHSHKLSRSWLLGAPTLSDQAQLVYLQFWEGFLSPLFSAQGAPPSLLRVFIVLIAYYSVSLFSLDGGQSV
jgi:hypothetical protein